ncbi:hypothetical protein NL676_011881 [Syzygium grande]|nr:hypothetical protein NL676_011881 [Syzygium grande]
MFPPKFFKTLKSHEDYKLNQAREMAIWASGMFEPRRPFSLSGHATILRPWKIYSHLPSFARKHLKTLPGDIKLQLPDVKQWPVRRISNRGKDNSLEEGDVCVFELVETEDIVLNINIFQVLKDRNSQQ